MTTLKKYLKAKNNIVKGMSVKDACKNANIAVSGYYKQREKESEAETETTPSQGAMTSESFDRYIVDMYADKIIKDIMAEVESRLNIKL
jgi:hypothetical protein